MKIAAFTTMNRAYYDHCGRSMLRSYKQHWSDLMPMYVYNEDNFEIKVKTITSQGWIESQDYRDFQARHKNSHIKKFAKKGFSVIHAMQNIDCDRLLWLDADTVIQNSIPQQLLEWISPDDVLSSHFSVWHEQDKKLWHSCETGFFMINKRHAGFADFLNAYRDIYVNDRTENLRRFYDGEVYGLTVDVMADKGYAMQNLNPGRHKTPIGRSVLAPYLTHFKAGVKDKMSNDDIEQNFGLED